MIDLSRSYQPPREDPTVGTLRSVLTGIGSGLAGIAHRKVKEMERGKLAQEFQQVGYDAPTAQLLSRIYQEAGPENFHKTLGLLGGFQNPQQQQMQPGEMGEGQQAQAPGVSLQQALGAKSSGGQSSADVKREIADQNRIQPFINAQEKDFEHSKKLYSKAKNMLNILEKNKEDWPGWLTGKFPETLHRNPEVRKYLADANTLVTLLANSRKGQPTNAKIRFEQLSKPNLDQPYETQKSLLEDIIKESEYVFGVQKKLDEIKQQNNGKYPADISQRIIEYGLESIDNEGNNKQDQGLQLGSVREVNGQKQAWNPETGKWQNAEW